MKYLVLLLMLPINVYGQYEIKPAPNYGPQVETKQMILFFSTKGCAPCNKWLLEEEPKLRSQGFITGSQGKVHICMIRIDETPNADKFVEYYKITQVPTFVRIEPGKAPSILQGYQTAKTIQTFYYSPPKQVTRRAGPTWYWPGNLSQHLAQVHKVDPSNMSHQDMVALHDNLHNGY